MGKREAVMRVARFERNRVEELEAENAVMGLKPTITFLFEPTPEGTKFTRKIAMTFSFGSRVADPMMRGPIEKNDRQFVENLKELLACFVAYTGAWWRSEIHRLLPGLFWVQRVLARTTCKKVRLADPGSQRGSRKTGQRGRERPGRDRSAT